MQALGFADSALPEQIGQENNQTIQTDSLQTGWEEEQTIIRYGTKHDVFSLRHHVL